MCCLSWCRYRKSLQKRNVRSQATYTLQLSQSTQYTYSVSNWQSPVLSFGFGCGRPEVVVFSNGSCRWWNRLIFAVLTLKLVRRSKFKFALLTEKHETSQLFACYFNSPWEKKILCTVTQLNDLRFADPQSETRSTLLPGGPAPELLFDKYKWISSGVNITDGEQPRCLRIEYFVSYTRLRVELEFSPNHMQRIHLDNLAGIKKLYFLGLFISHFDFDVTLLI